MKRTIMLITTAFLLSACSQNNNKKIFYHDEISGEKIEIPVTMDDLLIEDVWFYPLKDIPDYYGIHVRVTNKSNQFITTLTVAFRGEKNGQEYSEAAKLYSNEICQGTCTRAESFFEGSMYFDGDLKTVEETMSLYSLSYFLQHENDEEGTYYIYFFDSEKYEVRNKYK